MPSFFFNHPSPSLQSQHPDLNKDTELKLNKVSQLIRENKQVLENNREIDFSSVGHFDIGLAQNKSLVQHSTQDYLLQLSRLKRYDVKTALCYVTGFIALAVAALLPLLTLAIAIPAFSYGGYLLGKRGEYLTEYQGSLDTIRDVYTWCLNDRKAKISKDGQELNKKEDIFSSLDSDIQGLISALSPMLGDKELNALTRNDIETELKEALDKRDEQAITNQTTSKAQLSFSYLLYGSHQGGGWQITRGVFEMLRRAIVSGAKSTWSFLNRESDEQPSAEVLMHSRR